MKRSDSVLRQKSLYQQKCQKGKVATLNPQVPTGDRKEFTIFPRYIALVADTALNINLTLPNLTYYLSLSTNHS